MDRNILTSFSPGATPFPLTQNLSSAIKVAHAVRKPRVSDSFHPEMALFRAISASSRGVACAAYHSTPLRNPLFSLTLQKLLISGRPASWNARLFSGLEGSYKR
ncbi:MAG: hypothetical protein BBJ60_06010 [Desulfobacterales bacterium S7086C20]|nr:MAG: hypothetical protein BBJ60_06010 [Desulfobacterales bacterium S7086C20]